MLKSQMNIIDMVESVPVTEAQTYQPGQIYYNAFCDAPLLVLQADYVTYYGRPYLVNAVILWLDSNELQQTHMDLEADDKVLIPSKELTREIRKCIRAWKRGELHEII